MSFPDLVYDWNLHLGPLVPARGRVDLNDETLRDGLQSPSVRTPSIEEKIEILHLLAAVGVDSLDLGLPGAGPHVVADVERLAREIVDAKLPLQANCAARTLEVDIRPIVEIAQRTGLQIEVACFLGSSPIRQYAESWTLERLRGLVREAVGFAVRHGLPVMFVTEDTTRARPEDLRVLYLEAIEAGARRLCIADTVGHATPEGTRALVSYLRELADGTGLSLQLDWHGHNDRGLGIANCLAAALAGADRIHGTVLGIGERVGNAALDQLLVNFALLGWGNRNLEPLGRLCARVSDVAKVEIPISYPVFGRDAFRTQTGVHAAAILKARDKGDAWLADRVYSSIPAAWVGRSQEIEIGPMSGQANAVYWLRAHGIEPRPELIQSLFEKGKEASLPLTTREILAICEQFGAQVKPSC